MGVQKTIVIVLSMLIALLLTFFAVGSFLSWSLDWHWNAGPGTTAMLRRAIAVTFTGMFASLAFVVLAIPVGSAVWLYIDHRFLSKKKQENNPRPR